MHPAQRLWWRLLDDLPAKLVTVQRWIGSPAGPQVGEGGLHPNPTSVVCLSGVVRVRRRGETLDLQAGQALLIAAGVWHHHVPLRPGSVWFGQGFLPAWSDVTLADHDQRWSGRLTSQPSRTLMDRALADDDAKRRRSLFAELVSQVLAESVEDLAFSQPALRRMVSYLWSHVHHGVTAADLVAASGLSRAQAYRLFTAGFGVPPREAIARSRLWLAEGHLAGGSSVAATAARCGFPSVDTFRRAWKRAHGAAPRPG